MLNFKKWFGNESSKQSRAAAAAKWRSGLWLTLHVSVCDQRQGVSSNKRPFHFQLLRPGTLSFPAADSIAANYAIAITCNKQLDNSFKGLSSKITFAPTHLLKDEDSTLLIPCILYYYCSAGWSVFFALRTATGDVSASFGSFGKRRKSALACWLKAEFPRSLK